MPKRRAIRTEDKEARRQTILASALALFGERPLPAIKVAEVARHAGLAKGTVFLYFPTKEALFLALLEDLLDEWLAALDALLDNNMGRWTDARVCRALTETLVAREPLTRLLTLISSVLEHNVDAAQVGAFKRNLLARLQRTGVLLEQRLDYLAAGDGVRLLLHVYAIVVGARQLCDPGPAGREALADPALAPLAFDFARELDTMLAVFLRGMRGA